ncbi:TNF superfamily member 12 eiger [Rhynchophorus ferrugineus]|uniref:TNF superfamily member 12 eiger n=1 Tax=Rhynchophorus ferrugineus TaxID=354439 RepID=UPI003FCD80EB
MNSENKEPRVGALGIVGIFACIFLFMMTVFNSINVYYLQMNVALLNEEIAYLRISGPCSHQSRQKRNIVGSTDDGVFVSSESYADHRRFNFSHSRYPNLKGLSVASMPAQPSYIGSYSSIGTDDTSAGKASVHVRKSRVMRLDEKPREYLQVSRSALKSGDFLYPSRDYSEYPSTEASTDTVHVTKRRIRQRLETLDERHPRTGRIKPLPTIHFNGDTSKYVFGTHDNFNGNGHLRHPQRTFVDWKASNWVDKTGMNNYFSFEDGYMTIKESGIYFIYAQIYYLDEHDQNGYRVYKNDKTSILQCTIFSNSSQRTTKGNTCYTAGAEYFAGGDKISIGDLSDGRYSLFEPGKSFFGVIKLGDIRVRV